MKAQFANYKSIRKWLKERTDKEFYLTNTKDNTITVVICRDNKLLISEAKSSYMSWFTEERAIEMLNFINQ